MNVWGIYKDMKAREPEVLLRQDTKIVRLSADVISPRYTMYLVIFSP